MIKKVTVRGFRCLKDVCVNLEPLTVLVGQNDSGKSSLLDALYYLSKIVSSPLAGDPGSPFNGPYSLRYQCSLGSGQPMRIEIQCSVKGLGDSVIYRVALGFDKSFGGPYASEEALIIDGRTVFSQDERFRVTDSKGQVIFSGDRPKAATMVFEMGHREAEYPEVSAFARYLSFTWWTALDARSLRSEAPLPERNVLTGEMPVPDLLQDGGNLPAVVQYLQQQDFKDRRFTRINEEFHRLLPALRFVEAVSAPVYSYRDPPGGIGKYDKLGLALQFKLDGAEGFVPASVVSDGALRLLAFLIMGLAPKQPARQLIDEPEAGIHIGLLKKVVELYSHLAYPQDGREPVQVLFATHSPYMLDFVPAESVRIFHRVNGGPAAVHLMTETAGYKKYGKAYLMGELLGNELEEGLLGLNETGAKP